MHHHRRPAVFQFLNQNVAPSFTMDFSFGGGDPRITSTRAGTGATYFDATGTLQSAPANTQRIDFGGNPPGVTNWIRNSTNVGAVVGVIGSGGAMPTNWTATTGTAGLTATVLGFGTTSNGLPYIDLRFNGTAAGSFQIISQETGLVIPSANNMSWCPSASFQLVGGTTTNVVSIIFNDADLNAAGVNQVNFLVSAIPALTGSLVRSSATNVTTSVNTAWVGPNIQLNVTNGTAVDISFRIAGVQFEQASTAGAFVPTTNAAVTSGATALGLLSEDGRTNIIRNPRCEGATAGVIGSGGVLPTFFGVGSASGLTVTQVLAGYECGIPFTDIRFSGVSTGTSLNLTLEGTSQAAVQNQVWAESFYYRLVGGTMTNVANVQTMIFSYTAAVGFLNAFSFTQPTMTNASLGSQRATGVATLVDATTAFTQPLVQINLTTTAATDFTIRIGAPQQELVTVANSANATSVILPVIGTPAATTRPADQNTMPIGDWWNQPAGTYFVEAIPMSTPCGDFITVSGTTDSDIVFSNAVGSASGNTLANAGVNQGRIDNAPMNINLANKITYTVSTTARSILVNGGTPGNAVSGFLRPSNVTSVGIGCNAVSSSNGQINGWLRRFRYWKRVLSVGELNALTT